jgi:predicted nucleic acid-binding protein
MADGLARAHVIDSNILLRISWRDDPDHAVVRHSVLDVKIYDDRLVAAMVVHKVPHLLTLDDKDLRGHASIVAIYHG